MQAMDTVIIEIRAAEGGNDAKDLVREQLSIYARYCDRSGL
jgi:protein subunit release factor A